MRKVCYNMAAVLFFLLLVYFMYGRLGYKHTFNLLFRDYAYARQVSSLPMDDRGLVKLGMGYWIFKYVKDNTPEDAVIYLPDAETFLLDGYGDKFSSVHFSNKLWATRYLYPRKVVSAAEYRMQGSRLPLTHVLVVNGSGMELVDEAVEVSIGEFGVFPAKESL